MAGVEHQTTLAQAQADISQDALRRFDDIFRRGAGIFSILLLLVAWEMFAQERQGDAVHAAGVFRRRGAHL